MNCNDCNPKYVPGRLRTPRKRPCPYQGGEPIPAPKPKPGTCACKPPKITLRTVTIPANLGSDMEGEAYAPKPGAYYDTIVVYLANGAIYIYDSNGVPTEVEPGDYDQLVEEVDGFEQAIDELYNPGKIGLIVANDALLETLSPTAVAADEYVYVTEDSAHNNRPTLYEYSASAGQYVYARAASPYYEKPFIDSAIENLQANINNVMNKEIEDVNNLQTNINAEVNARTAADTEISQRITDIQNSPDVRFIVGTYAELEELDKAEVGDKDYARVLQDENHEGASTYYQFNLADQTWAYVGEVGSYYTKSQIDAKFEEVPKVPASMVYDFVSPAGDNNPSTAENANITARVVNTTTGNVTNATLMMPMASATQAGSITADSKQKLDNLPAITEIGENLELTNEGVLKASGGGSEVELPSHVYGYNSSSQQLKFVQSEVNHTVSLSTYSFDPATGGAAIATPPIPEATTTAAGVMSAADKSKLDSLLEIKSLNDSLSLSEDGELSVNGGGGSDVNLLTAYNASPAEGDVYDAGYVNSRLDETKVIIGSAATSTMPNQVTSNANVVIGNGASSPMAYATSAGSSYPCVTIGSLAKTAPSAQESAVAIGYGASATRTGEALGYNATTAQYQSVALGAWSKTTRVQEVSIGRGTGTSVYPTTRYLANVRAGELDTDAVNMSQLNAAIARIEALEAEVAALKG